MSYSAQDGLVAVRTACVYDSNVRQDACNGLPFMLLNVALMWSDALCAPVEAFIHVTSCMNRQLHFS
jgi:hypothetical protein